MSEQIIEQITFLRVKKPPSLKQFMARKALAVAASQAKGETGTATNGDGVLIPKSALRIKQARAEISMTDHPEWVREWEDRYGRG